MLKDEPGLILALCAGIRNKKILNVCSADAEFYTKRQPHIWKELMEPLSKENTLVNLDIKNAEGVDIVSDCTDMKVVEDRSYDVVLFCSGIEHLVEPRKALREIERVLQDGGYAIFSAPGVYPKHDDPIDNMLRFPDRTSWETYLEGSWFIDDYRTTHPRPAKAFYQFDQLVYATLVRCRKFAHTPFGRMWGLVDNLRGRVAALEAENGELRKRINALAQ